VLGPRVAAGHRNVFALAAQFYIETTGCIGQQIVLIFGAEALMERIRPGKCHF
jgi:hypothetical protein